MNISYSNEKYNKEQPAKKPVHCMMVKDTLDKKQLSIMLSDMEKEKKEMECCGNCKHKQYTYLDCGYRIDGEVCEVTGDWIKDSSYVCKKWVLNNER